MLAARNYLGAVCALLALAVAAGQAEAEVSVFRIYRDGATAFQMQNEHLKAVIRPAHGGAVTSGRRGGASGDLTGETLTYTALEDRLQGEPLRYTVENSTQSSSVATLSLRWRNDAGLVVNKTFSLLDSELILRVGYTIENGSAGQAALVRRSNVRFAVPEQAAVRSLGEEGLRTVRPRELVPYETVTMKSPRWISVVNQESREGLMCVLRALSVDSADVSYSWQDSSIEVVDRSVGVPSGKVLRSNLNLIRLKGLTSVVGDGRNIACALDVETAGRTVRLKSRLLPLTDLSSRGVSIVFKDSEGEPAGPTLTRDPQDLVCGKVEKFTFYWEAPQEGTYTCEVNVSQETEQLPLVKFSFDTGTGEVRWKDTGMESVKLSDLAGGGGGETSPADGSGKEGMDFYTPAGVPLAGLEYHVGVGEYETKVFELEAPGLEEGEPDVSLPGCTDPEEGAKIAASNLSLERVGRRQNEESGTEPTAGRARFAFHLNTAGVEPGTYEGTAEFETGKARGSLPVRVKVWPVRRAQPGLVRLHSHSLRFSPDRQREELTLWRQLRRCQSTAVPLSGREMWKNEWVRLLDSGLPLQSPEAQPSLSSDTSPLPSLDFSELGSWLDDLLLVGMRDVVLVTRLRRRSIAPAFSSPEEEFGRPWQGRAGWFWEQFGGYVATRGFSHLYLMSPRPIGAESMDWRWYQSASVLASAGWSVCGPYSKGAVDMTSVPYLSRFGDLILVEQSAVGSIQELLDRKRTGRADETQVGLWIPHVNLSSSYGGARERIWKSWRMGISVIAVGPSAERGEYPLVPGTGEEKTGMTASDAVNKICWEGVRDALDEINYLAQLDWYLHRIESGGALPPAAGRLARRIRATLRSKFEERPAETTPGSGREWPPLDKRSILEMLSGLRDHVGHLPARLYWRDLLLFAGDECRMEVVVDEEQPGQVAQANILSELIRMKADVSVPFLDAANFSPEAGEPVTVLLGTDILSTPIGTALENSGIGTSSLARRLSKDKHMILELEGGENRARRFIVLLGVDDEQLGRAVMNFKMGLRQEGNWLIR